MQGHGDAGEEPVSPSLAAPGVATLTLIDLAGASAVQELRGRRILFAGATGNNGGAVLKQLLALGLHVLALSRRAGPGRAVRGAPS